MEEKNEICVCVCSFVFGCYVQLLVPHPPKIPPNAMAKSTQRLGTNRTFANVKYFDWPRISFDRHNGSRYNLFHSNLFRNIRIIYRQDVSASGQCTISSSLHAFSIEHRTLFEWTYITVPSSSFVGKRTVLAVRIHSHKSFTRKPPTNIACTTTTTLHSTATIRFFADLICSTSACVCVPHVYVVLNAMHS